MEKKYKKPQLTKYESLKEITKAETYYMQISEGNANTATWESCEEAKNTSNPFLRMMYCSVQK